MNEKINQMLRNKWRLIDLHQEYYEIIENIIRSNSDCRNMEKIKVPNQLKKISNQIIKCESIIILTGFVVKKFMVGETDGPPGSVILANVLNNIGKKVVIVTDRYSKDIIIEGRKILGGKFSIEIVNNDEIVRQVPSIIDSYKTDHIIAIERPGKNINDQFYSMRGENLSDSIPNTDLFFLEAKKRNITTTAIGDGGNELGMGSIKSEIEKYIKNGKVISAKLPADYLIVATVSNWGALGLIAALSRLLNKNLLPNISEYEHILKRMVSLGAVDGVTQRNVLSVDGFSLIENLLIYRRLTSLINEYQIEQ